MKPLFIILALVGVLFFTVLVGTRSNAAIQAPKDQDGRGKLANTYRPPGMVSVVGSALGRWSPKVKFAQTVYTVASDPIEVKVLPAGESFRRATIRVAPPGCASANITYKATDGEGAELQLNEQTWKGSADDPCVGSIVVRPKGGTLTMACTPGHTCSITFE